MNVTIPAATYSNLRQLADDTGLTMSDVLAKAIDDLYTKRFLDQCNRAYSRLRSEAKAWRQELEERKAWEQALSDGLEGSLEDER